MRLIYGDATPLSKELVPLAQALGRTLAEDMRSYTAHPSATVSAMDGYAARQSDLPYGGIELACVGQSAAGQAFTRQPLQDGQTVRVFTGAPIPLGADCVIPQENVRRQGDTVTIQTVPRSGDFIRPLGQDFDLNQVCLRQGERLTPRRLALAAAMNIVWLPVYRRPRVALLATGDELVMPGVPLDRDHVLNASGIGLEAFVKSLGAHPLLLESARDNVDDLTQRLQDLAPCDILVITGGVSVGERDLVKEVLSTLGMTLEFWKVAMRPGKPFLFGRWRDRVVFGFPGNPVSTLVCAALFLGPFIRRLQGETFDICPENAILGAAVAKNDNRQTYLRARLRQEKNRLIATPFEIQDSAMLYPLSLADCLILRPPEAPALEPDAVVPILRLSSLGL